MRFYRKSRILLIYKNVVFSLNFNLTFNSYRLEYIFKFPALTLIFKFFDIQPINIFLLRTMISLQVLATIWMFLIFCCSLISAKCCSSSKGRRLYFVLKGLRGHDLLLFTILIFGDKRLPIVLFSLAFYALLFHFWHPISRCCVMFCLYLVEQLSLFLLHLLQHLVQS